MTYLPRYFPMSRQVTDGSYGWFVCDHLDVDATNLAKPIHDEPCDNWGEAMGIADMMNAEEGDPRE